VSIDRARVKALFGEALALAPDARAAFLQRSCGADRELLDEVASLLDFHDDRELIAEPRAPAAAPVVEREPDPLGLEDLVVDDRYRVDRFVAEGGFGYVYRGLHLRFDEPIALKIFKPLGDDEAERAPLERAFEKEGALLNRLSRKSAAIAQCYDVGRWAPPGREPLLYTVLEWIEGVPLHRVPSPAGGWTLAKLVTFLAPVAEALTVAHQGGVAHRDVKPGNILVARTGELKLVDFGIAKVATERKSGFLSTGGPMAAFTIEYAAPEQLNGDPTGPWTDAYALATILVELLVGRHPTRGLNPMRAMIALCDPVERPTPRSLGVEVSDDVEAAFARALAVERKDRYPDVARMWAALTAIS